MANKNRVFSISGELVGVYKSENGFPMITVDSNGNKFHFGVYTLGLMKMYPDKIDVFYDSNGNVIDMGDYITVYGDIDIYDGDIVLNPKSILKLL